MTRTGRVVPLNPDAHAEVQVLLPWYVTHQLDDDEHAQVDAHLAGCERCRAELESERRLQAAHRELATPGDVERSLAAVRARIAAPAATPARTAPPVRAEPRRWPSFSVPRLLQGALAVQFALIVALALALVALRAPEGDYRVLGSAATAPAASLVVKFRADASERDVRDAVRASGARIVDGPTSSDAWLLAVPPAQEAAALQRLRAAPGVVLAESLGAGGRP